MDQVHYLVDFLWINSHIWPKQHPHPSAIVGGINVGFQGRKIKLPGDPQFDSWAITVYNDETWDLRTAFEQWRNSIAVFDGASDTIRGNGASSDPSSFVCDIVVQQLAKDANETAPVAFYTLYNAYPRQISDIQLDWDAENQIQTFQVQFDYDYHKLNLL